MEKSNGKLNEKSNLSSKNSNEISLDESLDENEGSELSLFEFIQLNIEPDDLPNEKPKPKPKAQKKPKDKKTKLKDKKKPKKEDINQKDINQKNPINENESNQENNLKEENSDHEDSDLDDDPAQDLILINSIFKSQISILYFKRFLWENYQIKEIIWWELINLFKSIQEEETKKEIYKQIIKNIKKPDPKTRIEFPKEIIQPLESIDKNAELNQDIFDPLLKHLEDELNKYFDNFMKSQEFKELKRDLKKNKEKGIELKGPKELRRELVEEFYAVEKQIFESIDNFRRKLIEPFRQEIGVRIRKETFEILFRDLEKIYSTSKIIVNELETRKNKWNYKSILGDLFTTFYPKISEAYLSYVQNVNKILENYKELMQTSVSKHFLEKILQKEEIEIESYIFSPIHHSEKYAEFISRLFIVTPWNHPDFKYLSKIQENFQTFTNKVRKEQASYVEFDLSSQDLISKLTTIRQDVGKVVSYPFLPEMKGRLIQVFLFEKSLGWCFFDNETNKFIFEYLVSINLVWIRKRNRFYDHTGLPNSGNPKKSNQRRIVTENQIEFITPERRLILELNTKNYFTNDFYSVVEKCGYSKDELRKKPERDIKYQYNDYTFFEGTLRYGLPTGNGKIQYPNGSVFTGTFKNGKKNGEGHLRYSTGDIFKGFWVDDLPHGNCEIIYCNGNKFSGFYSNGKKSQKGELFLVDGSFYKGDFVEDKFHGDGFIKYPNGSTYEGKFVKNRRHGFGIFKESENQIYEGDWENDMKSGKGKQVFENGDVYIGSWARNKFHGKGSLQTKTTKYIGLWKNGLKNGKGTFHYSETKIYDGDWKNNLREGTGVFINGCFKYIGEWKANLPNGNGQIYRSQKPFSISKLEKEKINETEEEIIEHIIGKFVNGKPDGKAKHSMIKRFIFDGEIHNGKRFGSGNLYFPDGSKVISGWKNDFLDFKSQTKMKFFVDNHTFQITYSPNQNYSEKIETNSTESEKTGKLKEFNEGIYPITENPNQWLIPSLETFLNGCYWI
ncbi:morn repeat-containing protein [Anaeramoeba ignava]|uniref:Morn repeat-containing protein n=1 Tax=Anaeramoeba ignava TaxID=1746090 RepID=A0A9Q0RA25_ANAIG|nr:morn repeat-containing protein [Anaeramoeba ignava]